MPLGVNAVDSPTEGALDVLPLEERRLPGFDWRECARENLSEPPARSAP